MEISELLSWLTDGLDEAEKAVVSKAVMRDAVKTKASGLKAQSEFDTLLAKQRELETSLDGVDPEGNPRGYRAWYAKHGDTAVRQAQAIDAFEKKYGQGSFAKAAAGELPAVA